MRRRRNRQPNVTNTSSTSSVIKYSCLGSTLSSNGFGEASYTRLYVPGRPTGVATPVGPDVVANYSSAKFLPGTKLRWEPNVSFTSTGRIYVGFTDNPEVIATIAALTGGNFNSAVKGLGDLISFPVWQETEIPFNTRMRRKMFDVNINISPTDVNDLDRSCQTAVFVAAEGVPNGSSLGSMWFHDIVAVEGLHPTIT